MNTRTRNQFLIALAVIGVIGVGLIFASRGQNAKTIGENKSFKVAIQGQSADFVGKAYSGDPIGQARYSLGSKDARLTVVEFSDYQCPYCRVFSEQTEAQFITEFVDTGKVRYVYRDLPLPQHQNAFRAASAAACASAQGKFWEYHKLLFRAQDDWVNLSAQAAQDRFADYASQLGLDGAALTTCVASGTNDEAIRADTNAGYALKIEGTPSFFINGYRYDAALPIEALRAILKDAGIE